MKPVVKMVIYLIFLALFIKETIMLAHVKMTNAICESKNKSWVTMDYCRLRAISRNKTTLTIRLTVLHPANAIDVRLELRKRANGYKRWLGIHTVDACAFLRRINNPVFKIVYFMIKDFSSVNHTCPYVGKQMLRDYFWDPKNFSLPMPSGDFLLLLSWSFNKKLQFTTNVYFTLYQDLLED